MSLIQPLIGSNLVTGAADFDSTLIGNSVWLDGSADHLTKSFGSGADQQEFVLAAWVQRNSFGSLQFFFGSGASARQFGFGFTASDELELRDFDSPINARYISNALFRDIGWYHVLASIKTSESTASDRVKIFVNGSQITSFSTETDPSLNFDMNWGISGDTHNIGSYFDGSAKNFFNGYVAQPLYISGKSIQGGDFTISSFLGQFTFGTNGSQFIPKKDSDIAALASAAGGNSFCLDFANSSDLGNDITSNNNDFTPTSMSSVNQTSNTPSLAYPLLNPLSAAFSTTLSNGNTTSSGSTGNGDDINPGMIIPKTGKWVWQITNTSNSALIYGVRNFSDIKGASYDYTNLFGFYSHNGTLVQGGAPSGAYLGAASGNDVYQIYYDADTRKMWVSDNGVIPNSGNPDTGSNEAFTIPDSNFDLCPTALVGGSSPNSTFDFGMDGVSLHANAQSFKPLTSVNRPAFTFNNPATGSFTGNASTNGPFVFLGFQPSPSDALTINSNSVTYGTDVDLCNNGFKVRSSSSNFNSTGTNTYSLVTTNARQINGEFPPSYGITN